MDFRSFPPVSAVAVFSEAPFRAMVARNLWSGVVHLAGDRLRCSAIHAVVDGQGPAQWIRASVTVGGGNALLFRFPFRLTRNADRVYVYSFGYGFAAAGGSSQIRLLAQIGRYTAAALTADIASGTIDVSHFRGDFAPSPILPRDAVAWPRGVGWGRWDGPIVLTPVRTTSRDQMVELYLDDEFANCSYVANAVAIFEAPIWTR